MSLAYNPWRGFDLEEARGIGFSATLILWYFAVERLSCFPVRQAMLHADLATVQLPRHTVTH